MVTFSKSFSRRIANSWLVLAGAAVFWAACGGAGGGPDTTAEALLGETCSSEIPCAPDLTCTVDPCLPLFTGCPSTCKRPVPSCTEDACAPEEYCLTQSDEAGNPDAAYCSPRAQSGAPCDFFTVCAEGLVCASDSHTCEPPNVAGEPCRPDWYVCQDDDCQVFSFACADGLVCEPTGPTGECFSGNDCPEGTFCCADQSNQGHCTADLFCELPLGVCALPVSSTTR